ncbi:MAG: hypothetical protein Q9190_007378 [Brigantiaea leucoxantha]
MDSLAVEIKVNIFTALLDLSDLKSLILTSTSFYGAFIGTKRLIIQEVVRNGLDLELVREISALAQSLRIKTWSREAVLEILGTYFSTQPNIKTYDWDVSTALDIYRIHTLAADFSADFASTALAKECITNQDGDSGPAPSTSELRRFERNFWKFELYCNLFRVRTPNHAPSKQDRFSPEEQKLIFFDHFAAYENEQLGCVHDYLWDQISRAFDDVAAHDVLWGAEWSIDWTDDYATGDASWKESLLSQGLARIKMMGNARTYEARYHLVQGQTPCPDFDDEFLVEGLSSEVMDGNDYAEELNDMTLEQARESSKTPLFPEPDDGPIVAWKWAYGNWYANCYFFSKNWFMRQRAYVMWDMDRLAFWGLFKSHRADFSELFDYAYEASSVAIEEARKSWEARSEIYVNGGRGWWSPNDLSRIEWPAGLKKRALLRLEAIPGCQTASNCC